jgi:hypothetical protein
MLGIIENSHGVGGFSEVWMDNHIWMMYSGKEKNMLMSAGVRVYGRRDLFSEDHRHDIISMYVIQKID